jgi:hypothetical protein
MIGGSHCFLKMRNERFREKYTFIIGNQQTAPASHTEDLLQDGYHDETLLSVISVPQFIPLSCPHEFQVRFVDRFTIIINTGKDVSETWKNAFCTFSDILVYIS